jgi:hypothetical protein
MEDSMYFSFSDGKKFFKLAVCAYCQLNTSEEHEEHCPLKFKRTEIAPEIESPVRIFKIDENKE